MGETGPAETTDVSGGFELNNIDIRDIIPQNPQPSKGGFEMNVDNMNLYEELRKFLTELDRNFAVLEFDAINDISPELMDAINMMDQLLQNPLLRAVIDSDYGSMRELVHQSTGLIIGDDASYEPKLSGGISGGYAFADRMLTFALVCDISAEIDVSAEIDKAYGFKTGEKPELFVYAATDIKVNGTVSFDQDMILQEICLHIETACADGGTAEGSAGHGLVLRTNFIVPVNNAGGDGLREDLIYKVDSEPIGLDARMSMDTRITFDGFDAESINDILNDVGGTKNVGVTVTSALDMDASVLAAVGIVPESLLDINFIEFSVNGDIPCGIPKGIVDRLGNTDFLNDILSKGKMTDYFFMQPILEYFGLFVSEEDFNNLIGLPGAIGDEIRKALSGQTPGEGVSFELYPAAEGIPVMDEKVLDGMLGSGVQVPDHVLDVPGRYELFASFEDTYDGKDGNYLVVKTLNCEYVAKIPEVAGYLTVLERGSVGVMDSDSGAVVENMDAAAIVKPGAVRNDEYMGIGGSTPMSRDGLLYDLCRYYDGERSYDVAKVRDITASKGDVLRIVSDTSFMADRFYVDWSYLEENDENGTYTLYFEDGLVPVDGHIAGVLVFPNDVTEIPDGYFGSCKYLTEIVFGDTDFPSDRSIDIGKGAFAGCTSLTKVTFNGSIGTISEDAFAGCSKLAVFGMKPGSAIGSIEAGAFAGTQVYWDTAVYEKTATGPQGPESRPVAITDAAAEVQVSSFGHRDTDTVPGPGSTYAALGHSSYSKDSEGKFLCYKFNLFKTGGDVYANIVYIDVDKLSGVNRPVFVPQQIILDSNGNTYEVNGLFMGECESCGIEENRSFTLTFNYDNPETNEKIKTELAYIGGFNGFKCNDGTDGLAVVEDGGFRTFVGNVGGQGTVAVKVDGAGKTYTVPKTDMPFDISLLDGKGIETLVIPDGVTEVGWPKYTGSSGSDALKELKVLIIGKDLEFISIWDMPRGLVSYQGYAADGTGLDTWNGRFYGTDHGVLTDGEMGILHIPDGKKNNYTPSAGVQASNVFATDDAPEGTENIRVLSATASLKSLTIGEGVTVHPDFLGAAKADLVLDGTGVYIEDGCLYADKNIVRYFPSPERTCLKVREGTENIRADFAGLDTIVLPEGVAGFYSSVTGEKPLTVFCFDGTELNTGTSGKVNIVRIGFDSGFDLLADMKGISAGADSVDVTVEVDGRFAEPSVNTQETVVLQRNGDSDDLWTLSIPKNIGKSCKITLGVEFRYVEFELLIEHTQEKFTVRGMPLASIDTLVKVTEKDGAVTEEPLLKDGNALLGIYYENTLSGRIYLDRIEPVNGSMYGVFDVRFEITVGTDTDNKEVTVVGYPGKPIGTLVGTDGKPIVLNGKELVSVYSSTGTGRSYMDTVDPQDGVKYYGEFQKTTLEIVAEDGKMTVVGLPLASIDSVTTPDGGVPAIDGRKLTGIYCLDGNSKLYLDVFRIDPSKTYYGEFEPGAPDRYVVTFDPVVNTTDQNPVAPMVYMISDGKPLELPDRTDFYKSCGYRFVGWVLDGNIVKGDFTPTADTVLKAGIVRLADGDGNALAKCIVTVGDNVDDGTVDTTITVVDCGYVFVHPAPFEDDRFVQVGLMVNGEEVTGTSTVVTCNMVFTRILEPKMPETVNFTDYDEDGKAIDPADFSLPHSFGTVPYEPDGFDLVTPVRPLEPDVYPYESDASSKDFADRTEGSKTVMPDANHWTVTDVVDYKEGPGIDKTVSVKQASITASDQWTYTVTETEIMFSGEKTETVIEHIMSGPDSWTVRKTETSTGAGGEQVHCNTYTYVRDGAGKWSYSENLVTPSKTVVRSTSVTLAGNELASYSYSFTEKVGDVVVMSIKQDESLNGKAGTLDFERKVVADPVCPDCYKMIKSHMEFDEDGQMIHKRTEGLMNHSNPEEDVYSENLSFTETDGRITDLNYSKSSKVTYLEAGRAVSGGYELSRLVSLDGYSGYFAEVTEESEYVLRISERASDGYAMYNFSEGGDASYVKSVSKKDGELTTPVCTINSWKEPGYEHVYHVYESENKSGIGVSSLMAAMDENGNAQMRMEYTVSNKYTMGYAHINGGIGEMLEQRQSLMMFFPEFADSRLSETQFLFDLGKNTLDNIVLDPATMKGLDAADAMLLIVHGDLGLQFSPELIASLSAKTDGLYASLRMVDLSKLSEPVRYMVNGIPAVMLKIEDDKTNEPVTSLDDYLYVLYRGSNGSTPLIFLIQNGDHIEALCENSNSSNMARVPVKDLRSTWSELGSIDDGDSGTDVPGGDSGTDVPGGDSGTDVPGGDSGTDVPGGDSGTDVPGGDSGTDVPGGDSGTDVPGGDSGTDVPGGDSGTDVPGGDSGTDVPGGDSGTDVPGGNEGQGKPVINPDGSITTTVKNPDGSLTSVTEKTDSNGSLKTEVISKPKTDSEGNTVYEEEIKTSSSDKDGNTKSTTTQLKDSEGNIRTMESNTETVLNNGTTKVVSEKKNIDGSSSKTETTTTPSKDGEGNTTGYEEETNESSSDSEESSTSKTKSTLDSDKKVLKSTTDLSIQSKDGKVKTQSNIVTDSEGTRSTVVSSIAVENDGNGNMSVSEKSMDDALSQMERASAGETKKTVKISGVSDKGNVKFSSNAMSGLSKSGAGLEVSNDSGKMNLSTDVAKTLSSGKGDVELGLKSVNKEDLSKKHQDAVGDSDVYDMDAVVGGKDIHELGGDVTISLSYSLKPGQDADDVSVYYMDGYGNLTRMESQYDSSTKEVSFVTNHFSYYAVGDRSSFAVEDSVEDGNGDDTVTYVVAAVIAVIIIAGVVAFAYTKR